MGRFTQEDIYRGDGLNLYAYCKGNPVVYYDPSGYSSENNWHKFLSENKGKKLSITKLSDLYTASGLKSTKKSSMPNRLKYMGSTPSINSSVGEKVINQMDGYGLIVRNSEGKAVKFNSLTDGQWYDISLADMSHKNALFEEQLKKHTNIEESGHLDAVEYWNTEGKYTGAKSDEVRDYMTNHENYYLEHNGYNRSDGASLKNKDGSRMTYDPPEINGCEGKARSLKK